ncbi:MAG: hypothetical protein Q4C83_00060 [Candidatus Saccharibacteria bacterium]|nr:hypothetical protein [Candidatus Saccharibacteria bacterium]
MSESTVKLPPKIKWLAILAIIILIVIITSSIFIIIVNSDKNRKITEQTAGFKTTVDENSGEEVSLGQMESQAADSVIPGSPALYGLSNLLDRGISQDNVQLIKATIQAYYANKNNQGEKKTNTASITIAENIEHTMEDSGASLYKAKFVLNSTDNKLLVISITRNRLLSIKIGDNDKSLETIYQAE